ncbi:MAG: hypothetical protein J1F10_04310 [Muribaculaceae bacterium]|nr:hypothetical protein [Muribaculaceae bacterium]
MIFSVKGIASWSFIFALTMVIPCVKYLKYADELLLIFIMALTLADLIIHKNWKKYICMLIVLGITVFYIFYSATFLKFNTLPYILYDALLTLKPFLMFFSMYAISPNFTPRQKKIISYICIANCAIAILGLVGGHTLEEVIYSHPAYGGSAIFLSSLVYLYVTRKEDGSVSRKTLYIITIFLIFGLLCGRSKYYGEFIFTMFALYLYKPGMFKVITLKQVLSTCVLLLVVLIASWSKLSYYFLGNLGSDSFDPSVIDTFARPVLYATSFLIVFDYIPFGSGYASFATYPSGVNYSRLYAQYGIDKVHGLSENYPAFICDAYYPSLAQFGLVGIVLFVWFFRYIYVKLLAVLKKDPQKNKYPFIIGVLIIIYILIESTTGTMITQCHGMMALMLTGIIASNSKHDINTKTI